MADQVAVAEQVMSQREPENPINRVEMSPSLRGSLQRAITYAYEQSHRQVTLEHLLLALAEDREAAVILEASSVPVEALVIEVSDYLGRISDRVPDNAGREPALGGDVQHIIQSAGAAAQKSQRRGVSSALALAAIVGDGRSPAAQMLRNHGLTFEHAIAALKQANAATAAGPDQQQQGSVSPPAEAPANQQFPAPAGPVELQPSEPQISEPQPNAPTPSINDDARLQNVQAAHDIIAKARERIAAARGSIATHAPDLQPNVPAAANGRQSSEPVRLQPEPAPIAAEVSRLPQTVQEPQPNPPAPATSRPGRITRVQAAPATPKAPGSAELFASEPVQAAPSPALQDTTAPPRQVELPPAARQASDRRPQAPPPVAAHAAPPRPSQPSAAPLPQQVRREPPQQPAVQIARPAPRQTNAMPPSGAHAQQRHLVGLAAPQPQARPVAQAPSPQTGPQQPVQGRGPAAPVEPPQGPVSGSIYPPADVQPIEPARLAENIPTRMRVGIPSIIEIRAPRAQLEAWSGGSSDPRARVQIITKAMAMRLKAPEGGFTIEIASPETQWSEGYPNPLSDDVVSWRWTVTPTKRGRLPLQLNVSTRVVGRDGLAAARALPEQIISIKITPDYVRAASRLAIALALVGLGVACGYLGESALSMGGSIMAQVMR